jgi:phage-related protein
MPEATIITYMKVEGDEQFVQAMQRSGGAAQGAGTQAEEAGKSAKKGAAGLVVAAAAATAMYKGYNFLKGAINTTVQLSKNTAAFSRVSGLSQKQSQAWVLTAQERGIQTKQLGVSMATLGRQLGGVTQPTKSTMAAFDQLGLSQKALMGMPMEQRMGAIANAFQKLPNGVDKAALSQRLFGRSGQQLLPLFAEGAKGLNDQLQMTQKLVPYQKNSAKQALDLAAQQRELNMAMTGAKVAIGSALLPVLSALVQDMTPLITAVGTLLRNVPLLAPAIVVLGAAFGTLLILQKVNMALEAFGIATMGATPLGIVVGIVALVAALVLAYQKVKWFHDAVNAVFNAIKSVVTAVVDFIAAHWKLFALGLAAVLLGPIAAIVAGFFLFRTQIMAVIDAVVKAFTVAFNAIKNVALTVINFIKDNWRLMAVGLALVLLGPIAAAVAAFFLLRSKVMVVIDAIKSGFISVKDVVIGVFNSIVAFAVSIPKRIVAAFSGLKSGVSRAASGMFDGIKSAMSSVVSFISGKVTEILNLISKVINEIKSLPGKVASPVTSVAKKIGGFASGVVSHIPGLAEGGTTSRGGMAVVGERGPEIVALPAGASVTPLPSVPNGGGGGQRPIITKVYLDRREIATAMASYTADLQAAR